jgi:site-specific recombinase XerD
VPGKPYYDLKRNFGQAVADAALEIVTSHTLRHTCASHLVMAGMDLVTVKEILRHRSIEVTMRYSHLSPEHKRNQLSMHSKWPCLPRVKMSQKTPDYPPYTHKGIQA